MTVELRESVAVVAGAAGGIGLATARVLQSRRARVALLDIDSDRLADAAHHLTRDTATATYAVDVTDREAVAGAIGDVTRLLGRPSVLINSVGWLGPPRRTVWQYTRQEWQAVFDVNLIGPMNCVRAVLPAMIAAAPAPSHIVNVASMTGMFAAHRMGAYSAAKHALVSYTETLEAELQTAAAPINVSLVCPGAVPTGLNRELRDSPQSPDAHTSPERRPEDVAEEIVRGIDSNKFYVFPHKNPEEMRYRAYLARIFAAFGRNAAP